MQNVVFALLLVGLNITFFLLLNVNFKVKFNVNKKILMVLLIPTIAVVVAFLVLSPERYLASFYMSVALFLIMGMRFTAYKLLSLPPENEDKGKRIARKFFDSIVFPLFLLFISFAQCMFLFVWNSY